VSIAADRSENYVLRKERNVSSEGRWGIPTPIGQVCGVFAGASVGMKAGEIISHEVVQYR
jgi:hypothetical protein